MICKYREEDRVDILLNASFDFLGVQGRICLSRSLCLKSTVQGQSRFVFEHPLAVNRLD